MGLLSLHQPLTLNFMSNLLGSHQKATEDDQSSMWKYQPRKLSSLQSGLMCAPHYFETVAVYLFQTRSIRHFCPLGPNSLHGWQCCFYVELWATLLYFALVCAWMSINHNVTCGRKIEILKTAQNYAMAYIYEMWERWGCFCYLGSAHSLHF